MSETLTARAQHCAALFRLGRDVEAGLVMIDLAGDLQRSFEQMSADSQQQWLQILGCMLACQEGQDWLALADYLEYELVQLLTDSLFA